MNLKQELFNLIHQAKYEDIKQFSTSKLADKLGVKRNTVSHYLNLLVSENKIIKIKTRPVIFLDRENLKKSTNKVLKQEYDSIEDLTKSLRKTDTFSSVIGHDQSLYGQIRKLKAAASYPGRLPVLINGQTGTGKSYIARKFFDYCVAEGYIPSNGKFVSFNCAEYADNPELLTSTLFGYAKGSFTGAETAHNGLFDEANNGMLFLDEVHRLDPKGQEKLFSYLDSGKIAPLGEAAKKKSLNVRLICATTEDIKSSFLATFIRRIPVQITMPPLSDRTTNEIRSLIIYFFILHAKKIKKNINVNNHVLLTLANTKYESNIGQLKNDVLLSVASALSKAEKNDQNNIYVKLADLPQGILLSGISFSKEIWSRSKKNILIKPNSKIQDFVDNYESKNYIEKAMNEILSLYDKVSYNSFISKAFAKLNNLCDYLIFKKKTMDKGELPLNLIKKMLNQEVGYLQDDLRNDFNGNIIVAISYYFYFRQEKHWQLSQDQSKTIKRIINEINEVNYTSEVVDTILNVVNNMLNLYTDDVDKLFLAIYLSGAQRKKSSNLVHCILLAHGYSTASSIADTVNKIAGEPLLDSFDMPIDILPEEIAKKVSNYIHVRHVVNGLILMVDMGSLEKIPELLQMDLNFPVVILNNVSTQLALFVANYIKERKPIESIINKMDETIHNDYRIIYPKMVKQNVILVCCTTGVGTANKIKKMVEESLPLRSKVQVMSCSYNWLKLEDQENALKRKYNVLVIIGTADPKYCNIPYISLEELVSGSKLSTLKRILNGILSDKDLDRFNESILRNFTIERVINSLTILDTKEVIKNIDSCIKLMEKYLNVTLSNTTMMALFVHISCMIERIIRNQTLETPPNNFKETVQSLEAIKNIRRSLRLLERIYNIKIPITEIKYIYDLIFDTQNSNLEITNTEDF